MATDILATHEIVSAGVTRPVSHVEPSSASSLHRLKTRDLLVCVNLATTLTELLEGFAVVLENSSDLAVLEYLQRDAHGELKQVIRVRPTTVDRRNDRSTKQLIALGQACCRKGDVVFLQQAAPTRFILAAPVAFRGRDPEAIGMVIAGEQSISSAIMIAQCIATHIALWHETSERRQADADSQYANATTELVERVIAAPSFQEAAITLAGDLGKYLKSKRVAVGICLDKSGRNRLAAVSDISHFDEKSSTGKALESAMDEVTLRQSPLVWPPKDDSQRHAALAHKHLHTLEPGYTVLSFPLRTDVGVDVGAIIVVDDGNGDLENTQRFMSAAACSLATSLLAAKRMEGGVLAKLSRLVTESWRGGRGKIIASALVLITVAMAIPFPYKIKCECQIEPIKRRHVAAPFDGTLEESLVKPGDIVCSGDLLGRMDGREVRWKRASIDADRNQAIKRRDVAQASHKYADQQIARLEIERMDVELELLNHRSENLEIRSPIDGIVVSGDLQRANGAPLSTGQSLYEIAPLETMVVEVAVADDDIHHVSPLQPIEIRIDACPGEIWKATVARVHPRSEIRNEANVFIAEVELDNQVGRLRPGMKGRAKIESASQALGWILFHKPWEYLCRKVSW